MVVTFRTLIHAPLAGRLYAQGGTHKRGREREKGEVSK